MKLKKRNGGHPNKMLSNMCWMVKETSYNFKRKDWEKLQAAEWNQEVYDVQLHDCDG